MSAPALIVVAQGSQDPRVAQIAHALRSELAQLHESVRVRGAFLDHCPPGGMQVVRQLVTEGVTEVVFVPLNINRATEHDDQILALSRQAVVSFPDVHFAIARPVGPEANLLSVLDSRMRNALAHARCLELDGLILASESNGDVRGSALLARRARQWATHHKLPCISAVADDNGPTVSQAIMNLRSQGRRHIAVGSFFLTANDAYHAMAEKAYYFGAISVSEPLGAAREVVDVISSRYAFAAMELLDFDFETEESVTA